MFYGNGSGVVLSLVMVVGIGYTVDLRTRSMDEKTTYIVNINNVVQ